MYQREGPVVVLLEVPLSPAEAAVRALRDVEHAGGQLREASLRQVDGVWRSLVVPSYKIVV